MIEYAKIVLWGVSFDKELFRKELHKIAGWCDADEISRLKNYCYEKYYSMFPDIIDELFMPDNEYVLVKRNNSYFHSGTH